MIRALKFSVLTHWATWAAESLFQLLGSLGFLICLVNEQYFDLSLSIKSVLIGEKLKEIEVFKRSSKTS